MEGEEVKKVRILLPALVIVEDEVRYKCFGI